MQRKPEKPVRREILGMCTRFLLAMVVLALARVVIPTNIFDAWPSIWMSAVEILPYLILSIVFLNTSLPSGSTKPWQYAIAAALLVPAALAFDALRQWLSAYLPTITQALDIWSLGAIPVYAIRPAALGAGMLLLFVLLWRIAFGGLRTPRPIRYYRLLSPGYLLGIAAGCLLVAYFHMVNYAQVYSTGTPIGMLFGGGAPKEAFWYHLGPGYTLAIYWIAQPMESLLMGYILLGGMRMFRRAYPARKETPPPSSPA